MDMIYNVFEKLATRVGVFLAMFIVIFVLAFIPGLVWFSLVNWGEADYFLKTLVQTSALSLLCAIINATWAAI